MTEKQTRLMQVIHHQAEYGNDTTYGIGKHQPIKTYTEVLNLERRGLVTVVARGDRCVTLRPAPKDLPPADCPRFAAAWTVDECAECLPGMLDTDTYQQLWAHVPAEGASPKLEAVWAKLAPPIQHHILDCWRREFGNDDI
jgi:hypothetical protein